MSTARVMLGLTALSLHVFVRAMRRHGGTIEEESEEVLDLWGQMPSKSPFGGPMLVAEKETSILQVMQKELMSSSANHTTHKLKFHSGEGGSTSFLLTKVTGKLEKGHVVMADVEAPTDRIPNYVFLTGPWMPERIVENNKDFFPDATEFLYYDDQGMADSMDSISQDLARHGVPNVADAFHMLRPMAYRADVWRAAIIWKHGGIYVDDSITMRRPLSSFVDLSSDRLAVCYDQGARGRHKTPLGAFWNGFFASRREEPALLSVIKVMVDNVRVRAYPGPLSVTGPVTMYNALEAFSTKLQAGASDKVPSVRCQFRNGHIRPVCDKDNLPHTFSSEHVIRHSCANRVGDEPSHNPSLVETDLALNDKQEHKMLHKHRNWYGRMYISHAVYCDEVYHSIDDPCSYNRTGAFGPTAPLYDHKGILGPKRPIR